LDDGHVALGHYGEGNNLMSADDVAKAIAEYQNTAADLAGRDRVGT
jgi:hypothetical protein